MINRKPYCYLKRGKRIERKAKKKMCSNCPYHMKIKDRWVEYYKAEVLEEV